MTEEDYVLFDTARLLYEKGFRQELPKRYDPQGRQYTYYPNITVIPRGEEYWPCPTHQMAARWLRDKHHLHIQVYPAYHTGWSGADVTTAFDGWAFRVTDIDTVESEDIESHDITAEGAMEAAIRYCLKKRIEGGLTYD